MTKEAELKELLEVLASGKPFAFDPATNFIHTDDGGAPENCIVYKPKSDGINRNMADAPHDEPIDIYHKSTDGKTIVCIPDAMHLELYRMWFGSNNQVAKNDQVVGWSHSLKFREEEK